MEVISVSNQGEVLLHKGNKIAYSKKNRIYYVDNKAYKTKKEVVDYINNKDNNLYDLIEKLAKENEELKKEIIHIRKKIPLWRR